MRPFNGQPQPSSPCCIFLSKYTVTETGKFLCTYLSYVYTYRQCVQCTMWGTHYLTLTVRTVNYRPPGLNAQVLRPPHWTLRARRAQRNRDQFLRRQERQMRQGAGQDPQGLGKQGDWPNAKATTLQRFVWHVQHTRTSASLRMIHTQHIRTSACVIIFYH